MVPSPGPLTESPSVPRPQVCVAAWGRTWAPLWGCPQAHPPGLLPSLGASRAPQGHERLAAGPLPATGPNLCPLYPQVGAGTGEDQPSSGSPAFGLRGLAFPFPSHPTALPAVPPASEAQPLPRHPVGISLLRSPSSRPPLPGRTQAGPALVSAHEASRCSPAAETSSPSTPLVVLDCTPLSRAGNGGASAGAENENPSLTATLSWPPPSAGGGRAQGHVPAGVRVTRAGATLRDPGSSEGEKRGRSESCVAVGALKVKNLQ